VVGGECIRAGRLATAAAVAYVESMPRRLLALAVLVLAAVPGAAATAATTLPAPVPCDGCWRPPAHGRLQWQLSTVPTRAIKAAVYDIDMEEAAAATVAMLHRSGAHVVCYISAGSWESWRSDAKRFPRSVLGLPLDGWPGERWLDIRKPRILHPLMQARIDRCARKGFDGVEFDNVDAYTNHTGLHLTAADQLRYDVWLANAAHRAGLTVLLKNDVDQVPRLQPYFDGALNEECFTYHECSKELPFVHAGKPVWVVEYALPRARFCAAARRMGFVAQRKHLSLAFWHRFC
jgi:hypothetical protein